MGILRRKGRSGGADAEPTHDLYYASDVHGSDICWRKFLGAGRYYKVPTLIMGGDLTGKVIVPVERRADGAHVATFLGEERVASDARGAREADRRDPLQRHVSLGHDARGDRAHAARTTTRAPRSSTG